MLWLIWILIAFILQMAIIILLEFRSPGKAIAWMTIAFILPVFGFILYCLIAKDYRKRTKLRRPGSIVSQEMKDVLWKQCSIVHSKEEMHHKDFQHQDRLFGMLTHLSDSPITSCNTTKVLSEGDLAFAEMLAAMEGAKHHIHIEFYIFRADMIGTQFQDVMMRKVREGVKVRMLCDGLGSYKLPKSFVLKLQASGIEVYRFLPPLISMIDRRINYRNHRKILIVDGKIGFVGGMNVGDDYLGLYKNVGYWRDSHVRMEGDAVYFLQTTFLKDWQRASGQHMEYSYSDFFPKHDCTGNEQVQVMESGPDLSRHVIQEMIFGAVAVAKRRIWITTPYFIPDSSVYTGLLTAAVSGIEVNVIIPYHADSRLVKLASLSYVEELLRAGVKFYEYHKGFIHSKVVIVDDIMVSLGTANLDMRSFFYNFEMTAIMFDKAPIDKLSQDFVQDMKDSKPIILKEFERRSVRQKGAEMFAHLISPLL